MKCLFYLLIVCICSNITTGSEVEIDNRGYVVFCPCMGRFGNQVDQTLGVLSFARSLDRTLVLPNFITYDHMKTIMIPFENIFQVNPLKNYLRVIKMNDFLKIMTSVWPKENRTALCYTPRTSIFDDSSPVGCHAKEGNPFGPYWDKLDVDFVSDEYFGDVTGAYDTDVKGSKQAWKERFPAEVYPVLAFSSAPAHFPSKQNVWNLQRYLRWNSRIVTKAKQFVADHLTRPFVGVHLRNDLDWARVCEHVTPDRSEALFASAQCQTDTVPVKGVTKEQCAPSKTTVVEKIIDVVGLTGAKSVFVSSDKDHMIDEINTALTPYDVKAVRIAAAQEDPYISLALLGMSDHFIGNCVSTFSHIVRRERDSKIPHLPTSYFGLITEKRKMEL